MLKRGSMNAAADGSIAQPFPEAPPQRYGSGRACTDGMPVLPGRRAKIDREAIEVPRMPVRLPRSAALSRATALPRIRRS